MIIERRNIHAGCRRRVGHRQAGLSTSRNRYKGKSCPEAEASSPGGGSVLRQPPAERGRAGGLWRRASLDTAANSFGAHGTADCPKVCEAICEVQQERRQ